MNQADASATIERYIDSNFPGSRFYFANTSPVDRLDSTIFLKDGSDPYVKFTIDYENSNQIELGERGFGCHRMFGVIVCTIYYPPSVGMRIRDEVSDQLISLLHSREINVGLGTVHVTNMTNGIDSLALSGWNKTTMNFIFAYEFRLT